MTVEEAEKYFSDGAKCYIHKDYDEAKKYFAKAMDGYTKAIESGVNGKEIYSKRGLTYVHLEDYPKAIGDFSTVIKLDANDKSGYADRGFVYLRIKDYPKAIDDFTKAIELDVNNRVVYRNRGLAYLYKGDYPEAIEIRYYTIKFAKRSRKKPLKNPYCQLGTNKRIKQWPRRKIQHISKKSYWNLWQQKTQCWKCCNG